MNGKINFLPTVNEQGVPNVPPGSPSLAGRLDKGEPGDSRAGSPGQGAQWVVSRETGLQKVSVRVSREPGGVRPLLRAQRTEHGVMGGRSQQR